MAKDILSVNLLNPQGKSLLDQILDWALYIGRLLIIITEVIALGVFLSRFVIDRKLIDLSDEIKKLQPMVAYSQANEQTYRKIQKKLAVSKENDTISSKKVTLLTEILNGTASNVELTNISVSDKTVDITAQATSPDMLSAFTQTLKEHPRIQSVTVTKVENKTTTARVIISVTALLLPEE